MPDLAGAYLDASRRCVHVIRPYQSHYRVLGTYAEGEAGTPGTPWHADLRVSDGVHVVADYYGKRTAHDRIQRGVWCAGAALLRWESGDTWERVWLAMG